jgi:hypothetical protein
MPTPTKRSRAGWWVAGLTVVFALMALVVLLRPLGKNENATRPAAAPRVNVGPGDRRLREQATLFDPTPLFLPTEWNTNQRPLPAAVQRQPGQIFRPFDPQPRYGAGELALPLGAVQLLPKSPVELLKDPTHDPFLGFDREDVPLTPLSPRPGLVEVRKVVTGEMVFVRKLEADAILPAGRTDWQPTEFMVAVTAAGLLGRPVQGRPVDTANSDIEEVDAFFRDYLVKILHLGERLPPGMYRVVVGP